MLLPGAFESSVRERDIFVFCLSTERSDALAREFNSDVCVEFYDSVLLLSKLRSSLQLRRWVKHARLLHGPVEYYLPERPPLSEWAVPERMIMRKTAEYSYQREYRVAFVRGAALQVNNVDAQITANPGAVQLSLEGHPEHFLRLGSLAKICRVHKCA